MHECVHAVRAKLNINAEIVDFDWTQVRFSRLYLTPFIAFLLVYSAINWGSYDVFSSAAPSSPPCQSVKRDGPNATVEALWALLKPALAASRLTMGQTSLIPPSELPNQPAAVAGRVASRQSTYLRFNSFDSANRASVAMLCM